MPDLIASLFKSETRTKLLRLLLVEKRSGSISELARRSGLSPRAVGLEVEHLAQLGLVWIETVGAARVVTANKANTACELLEQLFRLEPPRATPRSEELRASLAAYGAPLAGVKPSAHFSLEETLLKGLAAARHDGTVLRILPVIIAKHRAHLDWLELKEGARKAGLKAELGLILDLTGTLLGDPSLQRQARDLKDRRRTRMGYLPQIRNRYEQQVAEETSPAIARAWGFVMNMSEASFRSLLARHCPELRLA